MTLRQALAILLFLLLPILGCERLADKGEDIIFNITAVCNATECWAENRKVCSLNEISDKMDMLMDKWENDIILTNQTRQIKRNTLFELWEVLKP